jgi:hypothetical protein
VFRRGRLDLVTALGGGGQSERLDQELAGERRSTGHGSEQPGVGLGVELRDEERGEPERLRETAPQLRRQLVQANDSLRTSRQRERDASQALREPDEARPWKRRRVRTALRSRRLL